MTNNSKLGLSNFMVLMIRSSPIQVTFLFILKFIIVFILIRSSSKHEPLYEAYFTFN